MPIFCGLPRFPKALDPRVKILLLSAYDAPSHVHWQRVLKTYFDEWTWVTLGLPPRYFRWRLRGSSLHWSQCEHEILTDKYDLCLATSMVDLATLRGLVPALGRLPTLLYFHENQCAYPRSEKQRASQTDVNPIMVQLYSALAADFLCFNSAFNRQTFMDGLRATLKRFPDYVPLECVELLAKKSAVLPVPIDAANTLAQADKQPNTLVWNHRWEYDKGPQRLLAFLHALPKSLSLRVHVIGQSFRQIPKAFDDIRMLLNARGWLGEWGYVEDSARYHALLARTRYVISTAEHDFQGLAVLEAVARGCIPLVPDRLAYREIFASQYRYGSHVDIDIEAQTMSDKLRAMMADTMSPPNVSDFEIASLGPRYRERLLALCV